MTKDEALKLALEALERAVATCFDQYPHNQELRKHFFHQAITAIKEALAEPEQEPVTLRDAVLDCDAVEMRYAYEVDKDKWEAVIALALVEPEQEPVAWQVMVEDEAMKEFSIKDAAHDWCVQQKLSGSPSAFWIRPLYTSPPASKPLSLAELFLNTPQREWVGLTAEDIQDLHTRIAGWGNTADFMRAVEARLKEKNT